MTLKEYIELDLVNFFELNNVSEKQVVRILRNNNINNYYITNCNCLMHKLRTRLYKCNCNENDKNEYDDIMSAYSDDSF